MTNTSSVVELFHFDPASAPAIVRMPTPVSAPVFGSSFGSSFVACFPPFCAVQFFYFLFYRGLFYLQKGKLCFITFLKILP